MVYINNVSNFKDSIDIVSEVMDDSTQGTFQSISNDLSNALDNLSLNLTSEQKQDLYNSIKAFKETKTYYYLREDLKNSLLDLESQLNA